MYRVIEYSSCKDGMEGMQALINEQAAEGFELFQAVFKTTYRWVLIFKKNGE